MTADKSNATILPPRANLVMGIAFTTFTAIGLYKYFVMGSAMDYLDKFSIFCGFPSLAVISFLSFARQRSAAKAKA